MLLLHSLLLFVASVAAHGWVKDLLVDDEWYTGSLPYYDSWQSPTPERIVWSFWSAGNNPVTNVTSSAVTCNLDAQTAAITADINAGDNITFYWTDWIVSHKGPVITYLANCDGPCEDLTDPTTLSYFKIDEAGYYEDDDVWASDNLRTNNNSWTVTIPSDIASGFYLIRHEIIAVHLAYEEGKAEIYPMCANLKITGSGSAEPSGVSFPGAYQETDPGLFINIYWEFSTYQIPGPTLYTPAATSTSSVTTTTSSTTSATSSSKKTSATSTSTKTSSKSSKRSSTTSPTPTSTSSSTKIGTTSSSSTTSTSTSTSSSSTTSSSTTSSSSHHTKFTKSASSAPQALTSTTLLTRSHRSHHTSSISTSISITTPSPSTTSSTTFTSSTSTTSEDDEVYATTVTVIEYVTAIVTDIVYVEETDIETVTAYATASAVLEKRGHIRRRGF
ncbi:glycosyl hydrolase family 61-domain-containing protein [Myxozyma melibiosi]|uniref:Glycosyl hydrolase family 61-domain-containing protein n=1 Tax=Myxozyma melibiosi TaxID=54550 RepID=A0ABR1F638_9ASCO